MAGVACGDSTLLDDLSMWWSAKSLGVRHTEPTVAGITRSGIMATIAGVSRCILRDERASVLRRGHGRAHDRWRIDMAGLALV